jgi:hypothetical protein
MTPNAAIDCEAEVAFRQQHSYRIEAVFNRHCDGRLGAHETRKISADRTQTDVGAKGT